MLARSLCVFALLLAACGGSPGSNTPPGVCTAPTFAAHDGGLSVDGGSPQRCKDSNAASAGYFALGSRTPSGLSGSVWLPIQSCTAQGATFELVADGLDKQSQFYRGHATAKLSCGYAGPGVYTSKGLDGLYVQNQPSEMNSSYASAADTECTLCVEDDGRSGTVNCKHLRTADGKGEIELSSAFACP